MKRADIAKADRLIKYREDLKSKHKALKAQPEPGQLEIRWSLQGMPIRYYYAARQGVLNELDIEIAEIEAELHELGVTLDD